MNQPNNLDSHTGNWHRRGTTIILDDPFAADPQQTETGPGGGATPPLSKLSSPDLQKLAKTDPAAAAALVDRYWKMSDRELNKRAANNDETARAVLSQRIPPNDEALKRALGSDYRPPHSASVTVRRPGIGEVWRRKLTSGNMTAAEAALGFPRNMLATHTEARAVLQAGLQPGDIMTIMGQYDPCSACRRAMQEAASQIGATIHYHWMGGTQTFRP